jgi:isopentenyl phosphate kinase
LGGSLITDKRVAEAPRLEVIDRLAQEIAAARALTPRCSW